MDWRRIALWVAFVVVVAAAVVLIGRVAVLTFKSQRDPRAEFMPRGPALHSAVVRITAST